METIWTRETLKAPHQAQDKAHRIRRMFDAIAPRYDLVNAVCSGGRDAGWRRRAVAMAQVESQDDVLDIACGTGDFARAFASAGPRWVVGCDFAHRMILHAMRTHRPGEVASANGPPTRWCEADALNLPFRAGSFSLTSCAFGVRNFQDLDRGLREMHRVLRPGGRAVILEFTRPSNPVVRAAYEFYAGWVMPLTATWISGDRSGAYRYLPKSVVSFLSADRMRDKLKEAGFEWITATALTFGVVTVYVARRC